MQLPKKINPLELNYVLWLNLEKMYSTSMKNLYIDLGFDGVSFSHSIEHLLDANEYKNIIYLNCRKRHKLSHSWSAQLCTQLKQFYSCLSCVHDCNDQLCLHIFFHSSNIWYSLFICVLHHLWVYYKLTMWPAHSWLDSSVVKHCTGIADVVISNPVQAWIFSGVNFTAA